MRLNKGRVVHGKSAVLNHIARSIGRGRAIKVKEPGKETTGMPDVLPDDMTLKTESNESDLPIKPKKISTR